MTPLEEEAARKAEERASLAAALVAALSELTVVEKGRKAKIETKTGREYEYEYADIADVIKLTRPVLASHGIVALTPIHDHGGGLACTVKLVHTSGESMDFGPFPFPHGRDAQATGSMVTYHRRYALVAALGIAAGDDDDGAAAQPARAWSIGEAKNRLLHAVGNDAGLAKEAWKALDGEGRWREWEADGFPAAEVEAWVNQPAGPDVTGGET